MTAPARCATRWRRRSPAEAAVRRAVEQAQDENHLVREVDPLQVAFEIHGLILALHYEARFLKVPGATERARLGFARILERYRVQPGTAVRKR